MFACLTVFVGLIGINGGTRHEAYIQPPSHRSYVLMLSWVAQPFGIFAVGLGKISVGFLILRILGRTGKRRQYCIWALVVLTFIFTVTNVIFNFVQCSPTSALWDASVRASGHFKCWDSSIESDYSIFTASFNAFVDLVLALMPVTIIWGLKMPLSKRLGLIALMGCGVFGAICTIIKARLLTKLTARSDFTWQTYDLYLWVSAEITIIILCGSIPTFKPLWDRFVKRKPTLSSKYGGAYSFGTEGSTWANKGSRGESAPRSNIQGTGTELWNWHKDGNNNTIETEIFSARGHRQSFPDDSSVSRLHPGEEGSERINVTQTVELEWHRAGRGGSVA